MELLKAKDNLTYIWNDVTFTIKTQATVGDKFDLDMTGEWKDGVFEMKMGAYWKKLIELFVVGWSGVTEDGKPVPYSYQTLMRRLPANKVEDILLKLGSFIAEKVGLYGQPEDAKKNG